MGAVYSSVHGHSFNVEWPDRLTSITRAGWGLVLTGRRTGGYAGPANWVHAALPVVGTSPAGLFVRLQLRRVWVLVDTGDNPRVKVTNLHVWEGARGRLAAFDGLDERGSARLVAAVMEPMPVLRANQDAAVGLSIGFELPILIDEGSTAPPPPSITFRSAGADFEMQEV